MNIGIIVDNEFNSDVRVTREARILKEAGHDVYVLCFGFGASKYNDSEDFKITRIWIARIKKNILFFLMIRFPFYEKLWKDHINRFIVNNDIDKLHVHDLYMSKAAHLGVKSSNLEIDIILDLHENYPYAIQTYNWTKGYLRSWLSQPNRWIAKENEYLSYASKIIVLSQDYKLSLCNKYRNLDVDNIIVFPNVVDLRQFEQFKVDASLMKSEAITLMYFGAVAERRGIFDTLEVFQKGLESGLNIDLLIIGPVDKSDKDKFINLIRNERIREFVRYIPWIELSELLSYMEISDILLSPLHKNKQHESGVANKIFQYMYGEKPIIVSGCKPQKDLVESLNCGLSYTTNEEYLMCIIKLVNNDVLRKELGKNGRRELYIQFDNKRLENNLLRLYKN